MLSTRLTRRAAARAAIIGLALGLVALAAVAGWGTVETRATTARVRQIVEVDEVWNRLYPRITAEDFALREYLDTGGVDTRRARLVGLVGSAEPDFTWLRQHGDGAEVVRAQAVHEEYLGFTTVLQEAIGIADPSRMASYADLAERFFVPMRDHVVADLERKRQELDAYLVRSDRRGLVLRWIGGGVVLVDLLLCVISSAVLVGYQRRAERELALNRHKAQHDDLTGLPNRRLLVERAALAVARARRDHQLAGLLLIDLDRFKDVNDTLGHETGDALLRMVGERIRGVARGSDTVARMGGDEFAILLPKVTSFDDIELVADRVRRAIQTPMELSGLTVDLGATVGAAVFPIDCDNEADLFKHADVARYVAKRAGFGMRRYNPGTDANDPSALTVLSELRRGIDRGELVLHYQPKVETLTRRPCGVEALVRWQHPERGLLPPGAFLPVIEPTEGI